MITAEHIVYTAKHSGLLGTPYSKLDCQALVEKVLELAGLKIPNYRGSNHMWRELVYDRTPITNVEEVPAGTLAFIVRDDGGEKKRGYNDNMKNATHVAIAMGDGTVFESTTGGVQYGKLSRFTNYGYIKDVDYEEGDDDNAGAGRSEVRETVLKLLSIVRDNLDGLEVYIREHL